MSRITDLKPSHFDYLKEMANIGAAHGATALSEMLNKKIKISVPGLRVISIPRFTDLYGERLVASNYSYITGDLRGHFFLFFSLEDASSLVKSFVEEADILKDSMARSVFSEVGNILCGSYLTALSSFIGMPLYQTPHEVTTDMAGAILSEGLLELSLYDEDVLLIDTLLTEDGQTVPIKAEIIFLPEPEMFQTLFKHMEKA